MRRLLPLVALLALAGCGLNVPPVLQTCQTWGCPEGQVCLPTQGTYKCVPNPTPTPTPQPTPTPTPVPTPTPTPEPTPTPTPTPSGCRYPAAEAQLLPTDEVAATRLLDVRAGTRALGDLRRPGGGTPLARENNRKLATWLRGNGLCAFAGQEAIFVQNSDGLWEEYHAAAETDGGWTQNPYKGTHRNEGPTVEAPPDAPPIGGVAGCGPPLPPPFHHFNVHRRDVRDGWEVYDATPLTAEGNLAYCTSVGFVNRGSCPARAEFPAWTAGDRLACERIWLKGDAPLFVWGGAERDGGPRADNPFGFEHRKGSSGSLKVCLADATSCQVIL